LIGFCGGISKVAARIFFNPARIILGFSILPGAENFIAFMASDLH
jgi:hypothetical protein